MKPGCTQCREYVNSLSGHKQVLSFTSETERLLKFLGHTLRKQGMGNLTLTGRIQVKRDWRDSMPTYLTNFCEWIAEQGEEGC